MLTRILRLLGIRRSRRRSSTHLTPAYEARRRRALAKSQEMFPAISAQLHSPSKDPSHV